ncbi:MAG: ABC transporter substrate-binding protein [Deltaproteobacteria bacterium]|nr:ABC transporter substrate-binding protein [Deltaproteobacteria bacterium]
MRHKLVAMVAFISLLGFGSDPASAQLKKIRFVVSAVAVTEVPFKIAHLKGFYREEGLDVEIILIRGALGAAALIGGSVDYSSAAGALIAAGVRGMPVRLVLVVSSKPLQDLVSQPNITSFDQLRGQKIGISSRGGALDLTTQFILKKNGLDPHKDVTLLVIGSQEELMIAMRQKLIAAVLLSAPRQLMLYREGFKKLAYSGDYVPSYPTGGIGVTEEKIRKNPDEIFSFVKASLKGLHFYRKNRAESIEVLTKYLGIKDSSLASQVYESHLSRLSANFSEDEAWMKGAIDFTKQSLGFSGAVPTHQIFDFRFVEKALTRSPQKEKIKRLEETTSNP